MKRYIIYIFLLILCTECSTVYQSSELKGDTLYLQGNKKISRWFKKEVFVTTKGELLKKYNLSINDNYVNFEDTYINTAFESEYTGPPYFATLVNGNDTLTYYCDDNLGGIKGPWDLNRLCWIESATLTPDNHKVLKRKYFLNKKEIVERLNLTINPMSFNTINITVEGVDLWYRRKFRYIPVWTIIISFDGNNVTHIHIKE